MRTRLISVLVMTMCGAAAVHAQGPQSRPAAAVDTTRAFRATDVATLAQMMDSLAHRLDSLRRDLGDIDRRGKQSAAGIGNFRLSGEVRARFEVTTQRGGTPTRERARFRARIHATSDLSKTFSGGVSLSSGPTDEPASGTQTFTGFFTRKVLSFERFFVSWRPAGVKGLAVTAGKFPTPWLRTNMTFSNDLSPEGINATWRRSGLSHRVDEVAIVAFALPMLEVASGEDSWIKGGQLQSRFRMAPRTTFSVALGYIDVRNANPLAVAVGAGTIKPALPQSNSVVLNGSGKAAAYGTAFRFEDLLAVAERGAGTRFPVALQLHAVRNVRAADGKQLAWQAEARVGATVKPGQWQISAGAYRIEQDAVIAAFNGTDYRLGSNSVGQLASLVVRVRPEVLATAAFYRGRVLDTRATPELVAPEVRALCTTGAGCRDPYMSRFQFDLSYTF
ncbi:MAG: putative porin [Gemmatimonadota bacterium]